MQRRVLIILPAYKRVSGYLNVLRPQVDKSFQSTIQNPKVIVENENLRISVINDFSVNDGFRGNKFHNILIHEDCSIDDNTYYNMVLPLITPNNGNKIREFDDEMESHLVQFLLRLGDPDECGDRRGNYVRDFTDTLDDKK